MLRRKYLPIVCAVCLVLLAAPMRAEPMRPMHVGFCRTLTSYDTCRIHRDFDSTYLARTDHSCRGGGNCTVYLVDGLSEQQAYDIDVRVQAVCARGTASFRHWDPRVEAWLPAFEIPGYTPWHSFYARKSWTPDARLYHASDPVWRFTCTETYSTGCVLLPLGGWLFEWWCPGWIVYVPGAIEIWMDSE